jgi:molybdate transport system substrate-binding protein
VTVAGTFPPDSHAPITYPAAATSSAALEAARYLDFLGSAAARRLFAQAGFGLPAE